jgi:hypothetical protein
MKWPHKVRHRKNDPILAGIYKLKVTGMAVRDVALSNLFAGATAASEKKRTHFSD